MSGLWWLCWGPHEQKSGKRFSIDFEFTYLRLRKEIEGVQASIERKIDWSPIFQAGWGYRKENCRLGKIDVAASALQSCSFLRPNTSSRCTPLKSATLASVLKNGGSELNQDLREQYEEECPSNCESLRWKHICINTSYTSPPPPFLHTTHNRYSVSPSLSSLSDSVKQGLRAVSYTHLTLPTIYSV